MRRMHDDVVAQRQDLAVKGVIELMGQTRRMLMAEQVRARNCADQQTATAEQHRGLPWMTGVPRQIAHMLRCVTWRSENRNADVAQGHDVGVADRLMIELQAGPSTRDDSGPGQSSKLAATTQKVVVDVRLKDMCDADALAAGYLLVLIDVTQRVNKRRNSDSFGDQQMGAVAEALIDELLDAHG